MHILNARIIRTLSVLPKRLGPSVFSFYVSLVLSAISILNNVVIGRDAALYLDVAIVYSQEGWQSAYMQYGWPWFSILLAFVHKFIPIPLDVTAYLVCALLMAGTCFIWVRIMEDCVPGSGWWACLVVLSVPGFNELRGDILREFGYWFFSAVAIWQCLLWYKIRGYIRLVCVYGAIAAATLFRPEAFYLIPPVLGVQCFVLIADRSLTRIDKLELLFFVLLVFFLIVVASLKLTPDLERAQLYISYLTPEVIFESFSSMSSQLAESMPYKYSRDDAGMIVFFGVAGTLLFYFLRSLGPFIVPFMVVGDIEPFRLPGYVRVFFSVCFFLYFCVLMLFFFNSQFVSGRYVSTLSWLAIPFVVVRAGRAEARCPILSRILVLAALLVMVGSTVSLSDKKFHYIDAGLWVRENVGLGASVYFEDRRIAFYAGRRVPNNPYPVDVAINEKINEFDYFVIRLDRENVGLQELIASGEIHSNAEFENNHGGVIGVFSKD